MATSSKFDVSSSSPDRPLYAGQRGSQIATSLDRSGSFRESMENPILSSLPNMSRSSSPATQGDVTSFFKHLRFDPKLVAAEHKSNRQVDLKRHVNVALGLSPDESSPSSSKAKLVATPVPEEIKRVKTGLSESLVKARQRAKTFNEALSVFNKVFPSIPSKKRSRSECFSNDRSGVMLSDRSVLGPSGGKGGVQGHAIGGGYELEQQKTEERTKNLVPNKRTRTSLVDVRMDVRTNSLVRPSGTVDRDKDMLRLASSGAVQGEQRTLPLGGDGWEKSRMKKKRSCIKPDGSPSAALTKPIDAFQESKQGIQQRLVTDTRSKLSNDSHSFRGVSNGTVGAGKSDAASQQTGLGVRASTPRNDQDNSSLINDRRDRPVNPDKERVNFRAVNKTTVRDEFNSSSPTSNAKMHTSIRAPRSGSGVAPKLSPVVPKAAASNDWEMSHCTTKPPAGVGMSNRKRVASARSSSPPVAHWAAQRPQKNSRTARRTNFMPIVSSNDDSPLDTASDVAGNDLGLGLARRLAGNSPQQIKLKGDPLSSSAALSESEESGVAEIKSKDKGRKSDEIDQKPGQSVQKVSNLVLSTRKNKLVSGEEHGDGVRRQGRTGRGFTSTGSLTPITSEKLGNVGTAKQLRSSRLGLEKSESKAGRPPTRKLSDRKAYTRQKHVAINTAADFLVGSDDGHEELLAAANGVINSARAFSSSFWRQMEPLFGWMSEEDINYWKQKENPESTAPVPTPISSNADGYEAVVNGFALIGGERDVGQSNAGVVLDQLQLAKGDHNVIPLCQRVMAALISDEDFGSGNEDFSFDAYETEYEPDGELELSSLNHHSRADTQFSCHSAYNGHRKNGKPEYDETECDVVTVTTSGLNTSLGNSTNGSLQDKALFPSLTCSELEYDRLDMNEKLLLELQSIGVFPEPVPDMSQKDDEGICGDIARLEENYQGQVSKKKGLLDRLMKSASVTKEFQKKEFEQNALDKLIVMAYEKYMACRGPGTSSGKSSSNKMAKQAALAFVKRTLDRCHQFEDTGKSCFGEPLFMDMFLAASSQLSNVQQADGREGELSRLYPSLSLEARTASMGSQQSPSQFSQNMDNNDFNSSDVLPTSEPTSGKEDLWSNRVKKRELPLDDVGSTTFTSSAPSGIGNSLSINAKGKRSERDRDGKGHGRDVRNGSTKVGRPALSSAKGERKSKTKPKQKVTQHSVSVNGLVGKLSEQSQPALPVSELNETSDRNAKEKDEYGMGVLDDPGPIDLSHLQLPGMDVLGDNLGGQGQEDLSAWFNLDDEALQDGDFMGLEIPMDDLADLNIRV